MSDEALLPVSVFRGIRSVCSALFLVPMLAALLFCPLPCSASPVSGTEANESARNTPPSEELVFRAPPAFTELDHDTDLFRQSEAEAVRQGRLLKLYLPQHMARQYRGGRPDAVTRQVLICGLEGQREPLDDKDIDLLARSAEGLFVGFARIPRSHTATPAQEEQYRADALRSSLEKGKPLLVDSLRTSSAYLHTCLIHFAMGEKKENVFLPCALATAVVPVKDTALFITVSSLLGQDEAQTHLEWVKETASAFADALVKANQSRND